MFKSVIIALFGLTAYVSAQGQQAFEFPADAELSLDAGLSTSFSCQGQQYGYYADTDNNCQVFHVCLPIEDDFGTIVDTAQWSFICGNQTIFDQSTLTCNRAEDAFPCFDAPSLYGAVEFGRIDK